MERNEATFAEQAKSRSLRADSADRVAPILPPASPSQINKHEIITAGVPLQATRIAKRLRRLRITLRPAAQAWPRRAARRLLSPGSSDRRGDA